MSKPLLIIIYKVFTYFLNLFTWIIFIIRSMKKKEEWIRKKERFGIVDIDKKSNNYISLEGSVRSPMKYPFDNYSNLV